MLGPTAWLQGGRVRRDHQFGDLRHCPWRYNGHLHHCVLRQRPPAQGKATRVETSEMLCASKVADYVCQFVILWPQFTYVSFSGWSTTRAYVSTSFDCDGTTNYIKTPAIHFYSYLPFIQFTWIVPPLPIVAPCSPFYFSSSVSNTLKRGCKSEPFSFVL